MQTQTHTRKVKSKYDDIEFVKLAKKWGFWRKLYDFAYRVSQYTGLNVREVLEKINEAFEIYEPGMRGVAEVTLVEREDVKYTIVYAGCGAFSLEEYKKYYGRWLHDTITYTVVSRILKC